IGSLLLCFLAPLSLKHASTPVVAFPTPPTFHNNSECFSPTSGLSSLHLLFFEAFTQPHKLEAKTYGHTQSRKHPFEPTAQFPQNLRLAVYPLRCATHHSRPS